MARWWAVVVALIGVGFLLYPGSAPYLRWYVLAPISILGFPQATGEFVRRGTPEAPPLHWLEPCQARYPGDLAVQVGCFLFATPNPFGEQEVALEKLDALQRQFPQEPALYLMQIRYRIRNFNFVRAESLTRIGANPPPPRNPDPQLARQLLRLATEGERIDPQNGFFPAIRGAGALCAGTRRRGAPRAGTRRQLPPLGDLRSLFRERTRCNLRALSGMARRLPCIHLLYRVDFP
ncbi:MAG: hypothetical protein KatS3mg021_0995 [Fimbriimonadales bacterium]|nr:MAG: hypothetical protein KatS3mg021_0995 [Fimbriimonadales bacterium]